MDRIWANLNELTQFAIILISLIAVGFHVRWTRRNTALGPTFLTTLGIFFCFTGIAWGLLNFDPADIRSSIPHLLEGIRTSFWASVVGIFWALTLKGRVAAMGDAAQPSGTHRGATIADLADHLARLTQGMHESNERLDRLNATFASYGDKVRAMQSHNQQLTTSMPKTVETANRELGSHLRKAAEDAAKHVVALDRALEEELTRSIETLGRQLTALSQKFVQDYTPLTVSLQRLVQAARA